jgi:single-strand DNA-binding protein
LVDRIVARAVQRQAGAPMVSTSGSARERRSAPAGGNDIEAINEVRIRGRLTMAPTERELPSGDRIVALRLAVPRGDGRSDALDATVWTAKLRRSCSAWSVGDVIELGGQVRRRFWRTPGGPASRWEIEVTHARRHRGCTLAA